MCTLVVVSRVWPQLPLLVAANRDERRTRPTWPPSEYRAEETRVFGPRDAEAGGTWLGLNEHGLFVGITNRFGLPPVPGRRSRGHLVLDALSQRGLEAAADRSRAHPVSAYNGFHLVLATSDGAALVYNDGRAVKHHDLEPGVHVYTERSLGAADATRERVVRQAFSELASRAAPPSTEEIVRILSVPSPPGAPFDGTVMDVDEFDYGTRSSTIIRQSSHDVELLHADGPPTRTPYDRYEPFSKSYSSGSSKGGT